MDKRYNLSNLEASFKVFLLSGNISSITLKNYLSDLRHFTGWINSRNISGDDLNVILKNTVIQEYVSYLSANKVPIKSVNRRLSTLRKFCSFLIQQGLMKENQAKKVINIVSKPGTTDILNEYRSELLANNNKTTDAAELSDIKEFISFIN